MKVRVLLEFRFLMDEDSNLYTDSSFNNEFWDRYLKVFDEVEIVARAKKIANSEIKQEWQLIDRPHISFYAIPYYQGLGALLMSVRRVVAALKNLQDEGAFIIRMPSILATLLYIFNRKIFRRSYGVEVVGDAEEVFSTLGTSYKWIGGKFINATKTIINRAAAAAYVSRKSLPEKYPVHTGNIFFFSSIDLPDGFYRKEEKKFNPAGTPLHLISVGSLDQMYKGPDILLAALKKCAENGIDLRLTWLGGGKYLNEVRTLADQYGLAEHVNFEGVISDKKELIDRLDKSDLFVLASRTEGLPRAMIEAMARGLPCIGSDVGGIPQLLRSEYLFEKEHIAALAALIMSLHNNREQLAAMSAQNMVTAREYANTVLDLEREKFYKAVAGT